MTKLNDPLNDIMEKISSSNDKPALELFRDEVKEDISLKTRLTHREHILVSVMTEQDEFLNELFPNFNLFNNFLSEFKRHKLSLEGKSREEFVNSIKGQTTKDLLNETASAQNLVEARK